MPRRRAQKPQPLHLESHQYVCTLGVTRGSKKTKIQIPTAKKSRCQAQKTYHGIGMSRQPVLTGSRLSWPIDAYFITPAENLVSNASSYLWLDESHHPEQTGEGFAWHIIWLQASQDVTGIEPWTKLKAVRKCCFRGECSQQPKDTHTANQVSFPQEIQVAGASSLRQSYLKHSGKRSAPPSQTGPSVPHTDSCNSWGSLPSTPAPECISHLPYPTNQNQNLIPHSSQCKTENTHTGSINIICQWQPKEEGRAGGE